jgi:hypothetical protein
LAFAVHAPSRGREEVLRSGQPGMDAGLVAPGHGWPMAAGPRSRTGARACRAWARHRTKGARALWLLWGFSKVTRRKGGTLSGRDRRNGYVHPKKTRRPMQSLREQARSHRVLQRTQTMATTATKCGNLQLNLSQNLHQMAHPVTCASHRADMPGA